LSTISASQRRFRLLAGPLMLRAMMYMASRSAAHPILPV
jgi:hypothetical protein